MLGISYRIQIGLAYCNGPKGAGRGSEKPTCTTGVNRGLLDRLYGRLADITVVRAAQPARPSTDSSKQPARATVLVHPSITDSSQSATEALRCCGTPTPGHGPAPL